LKLLSFTHHQEDRLGVLIADTIVDLPQAWAEFINQNKLQSLPEQQFPADVVSLLSAERSLLQSCQQLLGWLQTSNFEAGSTAFVYSRDSVKINPPVPNPGKIVCVGLNYADHCQEQNWEIPTSPVLFAKFPTCITGYDDLIEWPSESSQQVDYEAELAVVISKTASQVSAAQAYDYIGGYMIANDVSARDVQFADKQWVRGKSFDTFCPTGPYLVTQDEIGDPHHLSVKCWVNGELRQDSNTEYLVFKVPELIAFISKTSTLRPGDIICTGTPGGVGVFRDPPTFLQSGDVVEIEIDQLGRLKNMVA